MKSIDRKQRKNIEIFGIIEWELKKLNYIINTLTLVKGRTNQKNSL